MTAIAAKFSSDGKKIIMGSDSQTTWGGMKYNKTETSEIKSKIIKVDKDYAIACCGSCKEISLFQRYCTRTKPKSADEDSVFDFMSEFNEWVLNRIKDFQFKSQYIMAFRGRLFAITYGWEVHEHSDHIAGGSGMQCIGVAFSMGADVKTAIEMAIKHDLYCGGEINIVEVEV